MMKHRMMTSLAIAAIAAATLGIPAFAGEMKQEAYTVTVKDAVGRGTDRTLPGLKNSDGGVQYYDTEDTGGKERSHGIRNGFLSMKTETGILRWQMAAGFMLPRQEALLSINGRI